MFLFIARRSPYIAKDAAFPPAHHVPGRFQPCPNIEQTENEVNRQVLPQEHWLGAGLTTNRPGAQFLAPPCRTCGPASIKLRSRIGVPDWHEAMARGAGVARLPIPISLIREVIGLRDGAPVGSRVKH